MELGLATIEPATAQDRRINAYTDVLQDRRPTSYAMEKLERREGTVGYPCVD